MLDENASNLSSQYKSKLDSAVASLQEIVGLFSESYHPKIIYSGENCVAWGFRDMAFYEGRFEVDFKNKAVWIGGEAFYSWGDTIKYRSEKKLHKLISRAMNSYLPIRKGTLAELVNLNISELKGMNYQEIKAFAKSNYIRSSAAWTHFIKALHSIGIDYQILRSEHVKAESGEVAEQGFDLHGCLSVIISETHLSTNRYVIKSNDKIIESYRETHNRIRSSIEEQSNQRCQIAEKAIKKAVWIAIKSKEIAEIEGSTISLSINTNAPLSESAIDRIKLEGLRKKVLVDLKINERLDTEACNRKSSKNWKKSTSTLKKLLIKQ